MWRPYALAWQPAWVPFCFLPEQREREVRCPTVKILIHQPLGGTQGQASDIKIYTDFILKTRKKLNTILSENTGKPLEVIEKDTDRDNYMSAQEALDYGLIDKIITKK